MTNSLFRNELTSSFTILLGLLLLSPAPMTAEAQTRASASPQSEGTHEPLHGGSELTFRMRLNEALPEGARIDVRLSPVGTDQEITVSSGEPANKERTEFILRTKLPEKAVPGEWHIKVVWLFLAGTSWTNNTLMTNGDFKFTVAGPPVEIPTKATATLVEDHQ